MNEPHGEPKAIDPEDPVFFLWLPLSALRVVVGSLQCGAYKDVAHTIDLVCQQAKAQKPYGMPDAQPPTSFAAGPNEKLN